MPLRTELLRDAAQTRIGDLRRHYPSRCLSAGLQPNSPLVTGGIALLRAADLATLAAFPAPKPEPGSWLCCQFSSCPEAVTALALGDLLELRMTPEKPSALDFAAVRKIDPVSRHRLLLNRYVCPLNIGADEELGEELLMHLMTSDRRKLENSEFDKIHPSDILLRLSFIAVRTLQAPDLRLLDALNFTYECLPVHWQPGLEAASLYASWILLYARALAQLAVGRVQ